MIRAISWHNSRILNFRRRLLKASSYVLSVFCLISLLLLSNQASSLAMEKPLSPEANGDNPLGIVIERSEKGQNKVEKEVTSSEKSIASNDSADLIEDLIFPFAP